MCLPDQQKVHPSCHHVWYDWVFCAHSGTDDLGHPTPCPAAPIARAPVCDEEPFCPVCFVSSARGGWICSICSGTNFAGAFWQQVECAHCGDALSGLAGHVACRLCVAVGPGQPACSTEPGSFGGAWKPSSSSPSSPLPPPAASSDWEGDDEMDDDEDPLDFDLDVDEELVPIDDIDAVYDTMPGVARQTDLFGPAPSREETSDEEEEERDEVVVFVWTRRSGEETAPSSTTSSAYLAQNDGRPRSTFVSAVHKSSPIEKRHISKKCT